MSGIRGGLSPNGKWLALQSWEPVGSSLPSSSHFLLLNTSFGSSPVRVDLDGWFEFDALSNDGMRLYLIEYLYRGIYRVRLLDVYDQQLDPTVVVDKSDPKESMTGQRLMGVPSPDGQWLYSVYTRQKDGPFIHALNLEAPFANCINLEGSGYDANPDEFRWSLALNQSGTRLYAANAALGVVSVFDPTQGFAAKSVHIGSGPSTAGPIQDVQAKEVGGDVSVLSADGRTLVTAGSSGIVWVDTGSLQKRRQALPDWEVWGLGLTPDGKIVYAVKNSGQIAEVSMSSGRVGSIFDPVAGSPTAILGIVLAAS